MITYIIIAILLLVLELLYFYVADKFNIIDKPNLRSSHTNITLRGGGIIFLLGLWIHALFFGFQYPFFLAGLTAIAGISFVDDIHPVPNKIRLLVHFTAMFLLFQEYGILNMDSWLMMLIGLVLCVGIVNAYNFMDGINGITGGYSLAVLFPLFYVNRSLHFIDNSFLIIIILSVLVFCLFNFRKKAKCFAGDIGSVGIAFILLFIIGRLILQTGDFTYIVFLVVYGVDSVLTIVHRLMLHENIGLPHRKHLYQIMANELKIPHLVVATIYMVVQLLIIIGFIYFYEYSYCYLAGTIIVLSLCYIGFMNKYFYLHQLGVSKNNT